MVLLSLLKKLTKIVIKSPINSAYARSQGASETEFLQSNNVCPIILGNSMSSRQFRITVLLQAVRSRRGVAAASALTSGPGAGLRAQYRGVGGAPRLTAGTPTLRWKEEGRSRVPVGASSTRPEGALGAAALGERPRARPAARQKSRVPPRTPRPPRKSGPQPALVRKPRVSLPERCAGPSLRGRRRGEHAPRSRLRRRGPRVRRGPAEAQEGLPGRARGAEKARGPPLFRHQLVRGAARPSPAAPGRAAEPRRGR